MEAAVNAAPKVKQVKSRKDKMESFLREVSPWGPFLSVWNINSITQVYSLLQPWDSDGDMS